MKRKRICFLCFMIGMVVFLTIGQTKWAFAQGFSSPLQAAFLNTPAGADTAGMGSADAAAIGHSSNNPAILGFTETIKRWGIRPEIDYAHFSFTEGPDISMVGGRSIFTTPLGVIQLKYSRFGSKESLIDPSVETNMTAKINGIDSYEMMLGTKPIQGLLNDSFSLGIGAGFCDSRMDFTFQGTFRRWNYESKGDGFHLIGGLVYRPVEKLTFGGYFKRIWYDTTVSTTVTPPLKNRVFDPVESSNKASQYRIGASYQLFSMTTLSVDYQRLSFTDGNSSYQANEVFAGVEQGLIRNHLYVRAGWLNSGPTTGLGIKFKNGGVDFAYAHGSYKDLGCFFGEGRLYMASGHINF